MLDNLSLVKHIEQIKSSSESVVPGGLPAASETASSRVLIMGSDKSLLLTREVILRRAGYDARSVWLAGALPEKVDEADLIVLCQTLHEGPAETIRTLLRNRGSRAKVLQIVKQPSEKADRLNSLDGPLAFLAKVRTMLA